MKNQIVAILLVCCLIQTNMCLAQQNKYLDSLKYSLNHAKADTHKLNLYQKLIYYLLDFNTDSALFYSKPALQFADSLKWEPGTKKLVALVGRVYWRKGFFDMALKCHFDVLKYYESRNDEPQIAELLTFIGQDYADGGRYEDALSYFKKAGAYYEKLRDSSKMGGNYLLFGFVYESQGNYVENVAANYKALKIFEAIGDKYGEAIVLSNIAGVYSTQGNYSEALKLYLSAIKAFDKAKDIINLTVAYTSVGQTYQQLGNTTEAISYYNKAYEIAKSISNDFAMATASESLGDVYFQKQNYQKAIQFFQAAANSFRVVSDYFDLASALSKLSICQTILGNYDSAKKNLDEAWTLAEKLDSKVPVTEYYHAVALLDSATSDWQGAYNNYKNYIILRDSTYNRENTKKILLQQIQYENNKKDALLKAEQEKNAVAQRVFRNSMIAGASILLLLLMLLFHRYRFKQKTNLQLKEAYQHLQATQQQLVQQEKLASLGVLTAGIAHEIKNPLNFVTNFASLSNEILIELKEAQTVQDKDEAMNLLHENLVKITEHGHRADNIVKRMLEHSRTNTEDRQKTNINSVCDEYLDLAYHGKRAILQNFNCDLIKNFDPNLPQVICNGQDISRVVLNLIDNAFDELYECERLKLKGENFKPQLVITTASIPQTSRQKSNRKIFISVRDNGRGISEKMKQKIFEPFFTTKPTGKGTGLGLSLSFDIINTHKGTIEVTSKEQEGTEFKIILPVS